MSAVRWLASMVLAVCIIVAMHDVRSWLLAAVMLAAILTLFATYGAFSRSVWAGTADEDDDPLPPEAREHEDRQAARRQRALDLTP